MTVLFYEFMDFCVLEHRSDLSADKDPARRKKGAIPSERVFSEDQFARRDWSWMHRVLIFGSEIDEFLWEVRFGESGRVRLCDRSQTSPLPARVAALVLKPHDGACFGSVGVNLQFQIVPKVILYTRRAAL